MKKGWKIFWIACAVATCVGIAMCMAAFGLGVTREAIAGQLPDGVGLGILSGDHYFGYDSQYATVADTQDMMDGVHDINLEMWAGDVEILTADASQTGIAVETERIDKRLKLHYSVEGDELKFTTARNLTGLNGGRSVGKVRIYVPEGYELDDVTVDVGMGALYIEDICARGLQISVGAGAADIDDFQAQDVKFDCGAGRITARGETLQEADIDCGVGKIQYTAIGREEDYNYDIDCGIGEVTCGNGDYSGIGSKKCVDNGAAGEINIDCGVGSVEVRFEAGHENERHNEKIHNEKRHSDEDHNITRH